MNSIFHTQIISLLNSTKYFKYQHQLYTFTIFSENNIYKTYYEASVTLISKSDRAKIKKIVVILKPGKDVEKLDLLYIVSGNVKWSSDSKMYFGNFLEK